MEHSAPDIYEMHVIVRGKVQGVGFRAITRSHAIGLGLKGTVRNLEDGTVEICAQGSKQRLEEFVNKLYIETTPGQIEETAIEYFPVEIYQADFHIIS